MMSDEGEPTWIEAKPPGARHGAHHALLFGIKRVPRRTWLLAATAFVVLAAGVTALFLFTELDWAMVARAIAGLHPAPLIVAMAVLPVFGFPILPVYLVAGARFGSIGGGVVVTAVTAAHIVGTYLVARTVLRGPLERFLRRRHVHLPEIPRDEEAAVSLIAVLVPGLPYVVRNYLMAVAGLRLRVYFWISLPVHVARSYVAILLGDLGTEPDRNRLLILAGVELTKAAVCAAVIWWLREHHRRVNGDAPVSASKPPSA